MEGQLNPKKYNHPPQKVKSFGFIQVGLQAKIPKYEPWSTVVIPRFCYWINTVPWSPRLRAPHRKQLAGESWMKQCPDPYRPALPVLRHHHPWGERAVSERPVCDSGLDQENLPWLSVCVELAGEVWLQLLIFCWLTWDGLDKGVLLLQVTPGSLCCFGSSFWQSPSVTPHPGLPAEALREALCPSSVTDWQGRIILCVIYENCLCR